MPNYSCAACGKTVTMPFAWRKKRQYVFCSAECRKTPIIPKNCANCGKEFFVVARAVGNSCYCSNACDLEHDRREQVHKKSPQVSLICERCGKPFHVRKSVARYQRYCSQGCSAKVIANQNKGKNNVKWKPKITKICKLCGKEFETFPSRVNRKNYCCKAHSIVGILKELGSRKRTGIEIKMAQALDRASIPYSEQVPMFEKFCVDFLLTQFSVVIQCDGAYWHSPASVKARDKGQDAYLLKAGYKVLRFSDSQINNDIDGCIREIKSVLGRS